MRGARYVFHFYYSLNCEFAFIGVRGMVKLFDLLL
jgi:hypothetical protein